MLNKIKQSHVSIAKFYCLFKLTPIGTTVYRGIAATDLDAGRNKDIDFAIVPGDGGPVSSDISCHTCVFNATQTILIE